MLQVGRGAISSRYHETYKAMNISAHRSTSDDMLINTYFVSQSSAGTQTSNTLLVILTPQVLHYWFFCLGYRIQAIADEGCGCGCYSISEKVRAFLTAE